MDNDLNGDASERQVSSAMPLPVGQAFELYYGIEGRRTFSALRDILSQHWPEDQVPSIAILSKWAKTYKWNAYIKRRDYDEYTILRAEVLKDQAERAKKRLELARKMSDVGSMILDKADIGGLKVEDARSLLPTARALIETGMKSERLDTGQRTESYNAPKPVAEMTEEELIAYISRLESGDVIEGEFKQVEDGDSE